MSVRIRVGDDPVAHSFEEELMYAECFGDKEYERKLGVLQETLGALGYPVEIDREWIRVTKCRYKNEKDERDDGDA